MDSNLMCNLMCKCPHLNCWKLLPRPTLVVGAAEQLDRLAAASQPPGLHAARWRWLVLRVAGSYYMQVPVG